MRLSGGHAGRTSAHGHYRRPPATDRRRARAAGPAPARRPRCAFPATSGPPAARAVPAIEAPRLDLLRASIARSARGPNVGRLAAGHAAHDMLLCGVRADGQFGAGSRGVLAAQAAPRPVALVRWRLTPWHRLRRCSPSSPGSTAGSFVSSTISASPRAMRPCPRHLRSGSMARSRLAGHGRWRDFDTGGNLARHAAEQGTRSSARRSRRPASLADLFGLSLGFHACSQDDIWRSCAATPRISDSPGTRAPRSSGLNCGGALRRVAWHFITNWPTNAARSRAIAFERPPRIAAQLGLCRHPLATTRCGRCRGGARGRHAPG